MSDLSAITLKIGANPTVDVGATGGLDMNDNLLPNLSDPVAQQDAATKEYVDVTVASWTTVLFAASLVDQEPLGVDQELQIEFGAAKNTGSDPVEISAAGAITFNQTGYYDISLSLTVGRTSSTGFAILIFRILIDAVQVSLAATAQLADDGNIRTVSSSRITGNFTAGQVLTLEMQRSSGGNNDGGLFAIEDTGALAWGTSPSASVKINKFNP